MRSILLAKLAELLVPVMLLFSFFLLLRGHDLPGGGFIGGLVASAAIILLGLSSGPSAVRQAMKRPPHLLLGWGILIALASGLPALAFGLPFMTGLWSTIPTPIGEFKLGTPLIFDLGVFVVVVGVVVTIYLEMRSA